MKKHLMIIMLFCAVSALQGANYYVSPSGNDANAGTSPSLAWQTTAKVCVSTFNAGDTVMFEGGYSYNGCILFNEYDTGSPSNPIVITSYGNGRATIVGLKSIENGNAFYASNCSWYRVTNINFLGTTLADKVGSGIEFFMDLPNNQKLEHIYIDNVEISGFGDSGLGVTSWNLNSGFRDVRITSAVIHDCIGCGIITYSESINTHENVYIADTKVYNILGTSGRTSGFGILASGINGGLIERCIAYNNGKQNDYIMGPVGIIVHHSNSVIVQYCESYDNGTSGPSDGGGFDIDNQCSNSIMQYNYSHDNDGLGFYFCHLDANYSNFTNNTIRYNISQNDARRNNYSGIGVYGRALNCKIYNNTVFSKPYAGTNVRPFQVFNPGKETLDVNNLEVYNNIFVSTGGIPLIEVTPSQLDSGNIVKMANNSYFSFTGPATYSWNGTTYNSLDAWRNATGQEKISGVNYGYEVNPSLSAPGAGWTVNDCSQLRNLACYTLKDDSPLIDKGLNLLTAFSINPGSLDYYGNSIPKGTSFDIGAHERTAAVPGGPSLSVGATQLDFGNIVQGQTGSLTFNIGNTASGTLSGSITDDRTWITANPAAFNGNNTTVTVAVNTTGLALGQNSGTVSIVSNGGNASIPVSVNVTDGGTGMPSISLSASIIDFGNIVQGQTGSLTFNIGNTASGTLTGSITDDRTWITATPSAFNGNSTTVTVAVNTTGLALGQNSGTVSVVSNGGNASIPVSVNVTDGGTGTPLISVSSSTLEFGEIEQGVSKEMTFNITNAGAGVLSGTISPDFNWIIVTPGSFMLNAGETVNISVMVDNGLLGEKQGTFCGSLTIASNGGSDKFISVSMTATCVLPRPNPASLSELGSARSAGITFFGDGIAPGCTFISIYSLNGDLIAVIPRPGSNDFFWDCKNAAGRLVSPGLYIYLYKSPKENGIGKLTITK